MVEMIPELDQQLRDGVHLICGCAPDLDHATARLPVGSRQRVASAGQRRLRLAESTV
jgi:hypothetical protein